MNPYENISKILFDGLRTLIKQHDRPHGFDDGPWYEQALDHAKSCLRIADQWLDEQPDDNRASDDDDPRYDGTMRRGMRGFRGGKP